jgi:hypothetical protein
MRVRAVIAAAIVRRRAVAEFCKKMIAFVRNDCIAPACLRSIDETIFADFGCADNVYCCA